MEKSRETINRLLLETEMTREEAIFKVVDTELYCPKCGELVEVDMEYCPECDEVLQHQEMLREIRDLTTK